MWSDPWATLVIHLLRKYRFWSAIRSVPDVEVLLFSLFGFVNLDVFCSYLDDHVNTNEVLLKATLRTAKNDKNRLIVTLKMFNYAIVSFRDTEQGSERS